MARDDESVAAALSTWPLPKFSFEIDFGIKLKGITFQEVTGLDVPDQVIEYRSGNSPLFSTKKMPGIAKYGRMVLKKGVFVNSDAFYEWSAQLKMNTIKPETITIKLLDEGGKPTMQWQIDKAWPTKISVADMKLKSKEVAVEIIELAYELLTLKNL